MRHLFRTQLPLFAALALATQLSADPFYPVDSDLPAARVEDQSNSAITVAWQLDNFYSDAPIEQLLATLQGTIGGYELPTAPITFTMPDPVTYESTWLEYLRNNQIQHGLLEASATVPGVETETIEPALIRSGVDWVPPAQPAVMAASDASTLAAEAPVPEPSSLFATGLGVAMLALSRLRRKN
jgi:hypothetical protein